MSHSHHVASYVSTAYDDTTKDGCIYYTLAAAKFSTRLAPATISGCYFTTTAVSSLFILYLYCHIHTILYTSTSTAVIRSLYFTATELFATSTLPSMQLLATSTIAP